MKYLFLLRHAKSSWSNAGLADRDRPLNQRGLRDAPRMGQWLAEYSLRPGQIVSSSAVRALTTAETMAQLLGFQSTDVVTDA
ncbi:MAG: histidine phosphatase family protein, partial [Merismopedia sp. SIO2A8]|nr:histidine phosphatase family protein [Merismopedia sp. SIO2A8]